MTTDNHRTLPPEPFVKVSPNLSKPKQATFPPSLGVVMMSVVAVVFAVAALLVC